MEPLIGLWLYAAPVRLTAAAEAGAGSVCGVGGTGDIRRLGDRAYLVDEGVGLSLLTEVEVCREKLAVFSLKAVAEFLNCVRLNQGAGRLAFRVDGGCDVAGVLLRLIAGGIDVAVDFAAAFACAVLCVFNRHIRAVEAVQHGGVLGIEAVAETVCYAVELAHDGPVIEASLHCGGEEAVVAVVSPHTASEDGEDEDDPDEPAAAAKTEFKIGQRMAQVRSRKSITQTAPSR